MIENSALYDEIISTVSMFEGDEFPQTREYLLAIVDLEKETVDESPLDIVSRVMSLDKPMKFPPFVIEFLTDLLNWEIEDGNDDAMNDLGAFHYDGSRGFEQSFAKSVYYYDMAAACGNAYAQENLGYCYYYGRNVPVDYEKAFHYYALGAFNLRPISLYKIGDMYLNGFYVKKNEKEAFRIYNRCLQLINEENEGVVAGPVYIRLGNLLLNGIGVDADTKAALVCYQKAEYFLFNMVEDGNDMYRHSLLNAIEGAENARRKLLADLPDSDWPF